MEMKEITKEQILKIMPNAKKRVDKYLPYFNKLAEKYQGRDSYSEIGKAIDKLKEKED